MSESVRTRSALVLIATFVAGAVFGAGVYAWLGPRPHPHRGGFGAPPGGLPRWMAQLDLTADQEAKARAIFDTYRPQLQKVFEESFPKARAVNEQMDAELKAVLTPAQREKLDAWRKEHPHPMGFPPPPPPPK